MLREYDVKISIDGKGRYMDNIFRRSVKHEEVYLHAYDDVGEAHRGIGRYLNFYDLERPHQALGYQPPDASYRGLAQAA